MPMFINERQTIQRALVKFLNRFAGHTREIDVMNASDITALRVYTGPGDSLRVLEIILKGIQQNNLDPKNVIIALNETSLGSYVGKE